MFETGWLVELIKQGGLAAALGISLWFLVTTQNARLDDERKRSDERLATERKASEEKIAIEREAKEEIRLMWQQTRTAIENNTKMVATFMERFQVDQPTKPRKRTVTKTDHSSYSPTDGAGAEVGEGE
jgi:low affinity Fe/Cu permease